MKLSELTYKEINDAINYNPETGAFIWKIDVSRNVKAGSVAGTMKNSRHKTTGQVKSYLYIRYKDREMVGSRVAWLLSNKEWPDRSVMFIDGDTTNLKINNLRLSIHTSSVICADGRKSRKMSKISQRHYGLKRYYGMSISDYAEIGRAHV